MQVLFISYIDFKDSPYGSSVRPQKMYQAFLDEGHQVKLLSGNQNNVSRKIRKGSVREINNWLSSNRPDICYVESPVYPILLKADIQLLKKIHRMGVPVGFFYRDFHRKFPDLFPQRKTVNELWLSLMQFRTDCLLKKFEIIYFPSRSCIKLFSYKDMRLLPPAGASKRDNLNIGRKNTCIYVGGLSRTYGVPMLLDAFERLNSSDETYPLILVCREKQWGKFEHPCKNAPWLQVHHASGENLAPLYSEASLAVAAYPGSAYDDLAVSVKLFEYMEYGLPVIVSGAAEMEQLVKQYGIGLTPANTAEQFAQAVSQALSDEDLYQKMREKVAFAMDGNHWRDRARQVVKELAEKRK